MITDVMAEEVTALCGAKHQPTDETHFRAGSSPGRVIYEGQREPVIRARPASERRWNAWVQNTAFYRF